MALGLYGTIVTAAEDFSATKAISSGKTRLGLFGGPVNAALDFSSKSAAVPKGGGALTRLGIGGFSRGPLGDFTNKISIPSQEVVFGNTPSATYAPLSFLVAQDRVIDFTGVEIAPVTYDFSIIQGGQTVAFNLATSNWTALSFEIDQELPGNKNIFFNTATVNYSAKTFTIAQEKIIDFDVALSLFQPLSFDIIPGVLGEQTLTNADLIAIKNAVWTGRKIDGWTAEELLKFMAAVLNGRVTGAGTGIETFLSVNPNNPVPRVRSKTDSNGNRTSVELL